MLIIIIKPAVERAWSKRLQQAWGLFSFSSEAPHEQQHIMKEDEENNCCSIRY